MKVTKFYGLNCQKCESLAKVWDEIKSLHKDWEFDEVCVHKDNNAMNEIYGQGFQTIPVIKFDNGKDKIYTANILGVKDFEDFIAVPF